MKTRYSLCCLILLSIILLSSFTYCYYRYKIKLMEINEQIPDEEDNDIDDVDNDVSIRDGYPSGDVGIKYPTTYEEIMKMTKRNSDTLYVIGRTGCSYCEKYLPILKKVSEEKKVEIVYIDISKLSKEDYHSFLNSGLSIPGKCNDRGFEISLSSGFGTPLGLFVSGNKTYDCLRGYKSEKELVNYMKKIKYIRE